MQLSLNLFFSAFLEVYSCVQVISKTVAEKSDVQKTKMFLNQDNGLDGSSRSHSHMTCKASCQEQCKYSIKRKENKESIKTADWNFHQTKKVDYLCYIALCAQNMQLLGAFISLVIVRKLIVSYLQLLQDSCNLSYSDYNNTYTNLVPSFLSMCLH